MNIQTAFLLCTLTIIIGCTSPLPIGCTNELKACPGGEGVGRIPPNCEFAECPTCDYNSDTGYNYIGKNVEECSRIRFSCVPGTEYFTNDCGCGCKTETVSCTQDVKSCPDGSTVGRIAPDCSFASCPLISHTCAVNERSGGACDTVYEPVCGYFDPGQIQCVRAPCGQTYSNGCQACQDTKVRYWKSGPCPN